MISSSDQADSQEPKHANRYSPVPLTADSDPHGNGHGWLLRVSSDKSYKYLYYQQLNSITTNTTPHLPTPKLNRLHGLPDSPFCWQLLIATAAD
jgi:hypothetical protein